jgi:hypothetical protein
MTSFPDVAKYIGLSFFRVARRSDRPELHVYNEFPDIGRSVEYATKIGADVINMSLQTRYDDPFQAFKRNDVMSLRCSSLQQGIIERI